MKKSLSSCITIIGLCFLLAGVSFADGGGVKMVQEGPNDIGLNQYCEDTLPSIKTSPKDPLITGKFAAHQEEGKFVAKITLDGGQKIAYGLSETRKIYMIYIPSLAPSLPICKYEDMDLMERFKDFACKKKVDIDFGYPAITVYPIVTKIHIANRSNCDAGFGTKDKPMISGSVTINMSPLK